MSWGASRLASATVPGLIGGACLAIALLLAAVSPARAQQQDDATLRILVTSEKNGNPLVGANALLTRTETDDTEDGRRYTGVTDTDGYYQFDEVVPASYRLQISFVGHETYTKVFSLDPGDRVVERISLKAKPKQLDDVVVQGERQVTTGEAGVRTITTSSIDRLPTAAPGGDLATKLQTLPGVVTVGGRGGDFYIRGGTPFQNQVLVDNLPVVKPFHISSAYSAFPSEMVQNADLFTGGFSAEYMGATSALLDVEVAPGNMKDFEGSVAFSPSLVSLQAEGPVDEGKASFNVMGRVSTIEQTSPFLTSQEAPFSFYDVLGRYTYRADRFHCNATGLRTGDQGRINPDRDLSLSWSNTVIGARCRGVGSVYASPFDITMGYSNYQNGETEDGGSGRTAGLRQLFFKANLQTEALGLPLDYGFDLRLSRYTAALDERFVNTQAFEVPAESFRAHVGTELMPHRHLTIEPSFGSQFTLNTAPTIEPRLRLSYRPGGGDDQEVTLAGGRYRQIDAGITDQRDAGTVFTVLKPNSEGIPPQGALHGLLGYRHRVGSHLEANVEGYVKNYTNIPVSKWTIEPTLAIETAQADGLAYGADLRLEYENSPLYVSLGYGWAKVTYEAVSESLGAWIEGEIFEYPPAHDRRHKVNATANYSLGKYTASLRWEFGSGRPYTQIYAFNLALNVPNENPLSEPGTAEIYFSRPYGKRLPSYHRLDVSVRRTFEITSRLSVKAKAGVLNAYNRKNIAYLDGSTLRRVNQTPLLPYVSVQTRIN